jgi:DNA-nicking Smr family endonuclease
VKSSRLDSACKGAPGLSRKNKYSDSDSPGTADDQQLFMEWIEKLDAQEIRKKDIAETPTVQKTRKIRRARIDLHGLTVDQALSRLGNFLEEQLQKSGKVEVMVITGKGIRSQGRPVLAREAWDFVTNRYMSRILKIEDSPAEVLLGGIPIRGHFIVIFNG